MSDLRLRVSAEQAISLRRADVGLTAASRFCVMAESLAERSVVLFWQPARVKDYPRSDSGLLERLTAQPNGLVTDVLSPHRTP